MVFNLNSPQRLWKKHGSEELFSALSHLPNLWKNENGPTHAKWFWKKWLNTSVRNSFEYKVKCLGETMHFTGLMGDTEQRKRFPRVAWGSGFVAFLAFADYRYDDEGNKLMEDGKALWFTSPVIVTNSMEIPERLVKSLAMIVKNDLNLDNSHHKYQIRALARDRCMAVWQIPGFAKYISDGKGQEARLEELTMSDWLYEIEAQVDDLLDISLPEDRQIIRSEFRSRIT